MKNTCVKECPFVHRINVIKEYYRIQRVISTFSLMFAAAGIVLMIVDIEIMAYNVKIKSHFLSTMRFLLKVIVSVFTGFLLVSVILYHRVCVKLFMVENSVNDWRLVLTIRWCILILLELVVCVIHPLPIANYNYIWKTTTELDVYEEFQGSQKIPINVILTIVMFARGYILLRVLVLYSTIYGKNTHRCIEVMHNHRTVTSKFALKYLLTVHCKTFLIASAVGLIVWTSWAVRACEMYVNPLEFSFFNNVWFIAITFFTIGYGEIVPRSTCGRFVAVLTGTLGVVYTAYVVAVIAESLQLTYSEACLHQFVLKHDLEKRMKEEAAKILQCFWRIRKCRKYKNQYSENYVTELRLKLLTSKHHLKVLKNEQIQAVTKSLRISRIHSNQVHFQHDLVKMKDRFANIEKIVFAIENKILYESKESI